MEKRRKDGEKGKGWKHKRNEKGGRNVCRRRTERGRGQTEELSQVDAFL